VRIPPSSVDDVTSSVRLRGSEDEVNDDGGSRESGLKEEGGGGGRMGKEGFEDDEGIEDEGGR